MNPSNPIESKPEHIHAIQALADEMHQPLDSVREAYSAAFLTLDADARIKDYLIVLACKKVRDDMRR